MKEKDIATLVEKCNGSTKSIQETVNTILMEETVIKVGDTVAVVDDESASYGGMIGKAKVKSFSEDKQYANCEFPDGRVVPVLANQLYSVGA